MIGLDKFMIHKDDVPRENTIYMLHQGNQNLSRLGRSSSVSKCISSVSVGIHLDFITTLQDSVSIPSEFRLCIDSSRTLIKRSRTMKICKTLDNSSELCRDCLVFLADLFRFFKLMKSCRLSQDSFVLCQGAFTLHQDFSKSIQYSPKLSRVISILVGDT